ncbi:shikimate kinase [Acidiferrimicrobium sp. IK]|uniref:shikimate kinase n=1 Tax=Acidiferrimicrobium sp. IK TaxID=2871700 RepID=UPI0021CAED82|nr:shikimate kinase [Acidiferrimicrobium sp. IK]MCU4184818.1 shikimate kinase [Acidiferrimicrobium sp. IK]
MTGPDRPEPQGPERAGPERILLIGMMGAGKSTVGHRLAARLGWPYLDSDDEIKRRTGQTVPEIWHSQGESAFRVEEAAVLADAVSSSQPVVVAVAGGAVLDPANRDRIRGGGLVVWLRARTETLVARVGAGAGRPLLDGDPAGALAALYDVRRPVYADLAEVAVDVDDRTPEQIVDAILEVRAAKAASGA